ncbi:MAG TPA: BFD-like (2Fe-2S) protein [Desulfobulbaceae bacterium]|nr:BFD-like (2Fe-2S) protein [Desulfobulbaceae bacterium]
MNEEKVCYCFHYSVADIEQDIKTHGRSTIMERIVAEKRNGACECVTKNPKGR